MKNIRSTPYHRIVHSLVSSLMVLLIFGCTGEISDFEELNEFPDISPDYIGVVIPPNIAPLNFRINQEAKAYRVEISSARGKKIIIRQHSAAISIPPRSWKRLLTQNKGNELYVDVFIRNKGWGKYKRLKDSIATEEIDQYLVYRLINGAYISWDKMGIYQRNLETFKQYTLYENTSTDRSCVNCHMFPQNNPDKMQLHFRASHGGTVVLDGQELKKVETKTDYTIRSGGYPSWHPSGEIIAYSLNDVRQNFTSDKNKTQDVFDKASDIVLYNVKTNTIMATSRLATPARENLPTWSPDGRWLYFISAPGIKPDGSNKTKVKYDLYRIAFDPETHHFGAIDTVLTSAETGLSITFPVVSPDGRYILLGMTDYGYFPVYHAVSDIYLYDIQNGEYRKLACNSNSTESYHAWTSSGRWFVFSSKRLDDTYSRPYFSYFDENGKAHKPFVLPQKDPSFYDRFVLNFNRPEPVTGKVPLNPRQMRDIVLSEAEPARYTSIEPEGEQGTMNAVNYKENNETEYVMH